MQQSLKEGREERKVNGVGERERSRKKDSDRELRKERNNKP